MPFNPEQGIGKKESVLFRAFLALPFLGLSAFCLNRMNAGAGLNELGEVFQTGILTWDGGSFTLPKAVFHVNLLDSIFRPMTVIFASPNFGIDPVAWWQMLSFITDYGVLYSIFLIESTRRSNYVTFSQL